MRRVALTLVLLLAGCGTTTQNSPTTQPVVVQPPSPPTPPSPQPTPPPPGPPSINGRYLGQTVVEGRSLFGSVPPTTVQTDFNVSESGGAVTAVGKVIPTDNPADAADVTANGIRTDSSLSINLPLNSACGNVTMTGTIQQNGNIDLPAGSQPVTCNVQTFLGPVPTSVTVSYTAFTLVKQ